MTRRESTPDRSRTCNLRFRRPQDNCAEPNDSQAIPSFDPARAAPAQQHDTARALHVDLARVVELWPVLPPAIRAAILTLANTTAPTIPNGPPAADEHLDRLPPGYERSGG